MSPDELMLILGAVVAIIIVLALVLAFSGIPPDALADALKNFISNLKFPKG